MKFKLGFNKHLCCMTAIAITCVMVAACGVRSALELPTPESPTISSPITNTSSPSF